MASALKSTPVWHRAWLEHASAYESRLGGPPGGECALRHELVFCLLGGHGVSFELALSATDVVMGLCPFDLVWDSEELRKVLRQQLGAAQFDPRRKDGGFRRYRYPNRKAELLVAAREWVFDAGGLEATLRGTETETERREWLCGCPGIGAKSASWLLRNTGHAEELAIIDVHILRAMQEAGRLPAVSLPRDYTLVEEQFLRWCRELGAPVSALDLFLWEWQRGDFPTTA